jgi:hypothetical protein
MKVYDIFYFGFGVVLAVLFSAELTRKLGSPVECGTFLTDSVLRFSFVLFHKKDRQDDGGLNLTGSGGPIRGVIRNGQCDTIQIYTTQEVTNGIIEYF